MATALAGARTVGTDSAAANEKRHASEYAVWRFVKMVAQTGINPRLHSQACKPATTARILM
jgi:hypothetical protein